MHQGLPLARSALLATSGLLVALALHGLLGLGLIPAAGLPATAVMAAGLFMHRRVRPDGATGWDPCLLLTLGTGVLALTSAGILPGEDAAGSGFAVLGLAAYPLLIIGLLRLQSARVAEREADVLVQAGLVATTVAVALWVLATPARIRLEIPLGTAEVSVALLALDLLLLTMAPSTCCSFPGSASSPTGGWPSASRFSAVPTWPPRSPCSRGSGPPTVWCPRWRSWPSSSWR